MVRVEHIGFCSIYFEDDFESENTVTEELDTEGDRIDLREVDGFDYLCSKRIVNKKYPNQVDQDDQAYELEEVVRTQKYLQKFRVLGWQSHVLNSLHVLGRNKTVNGFLSGLQVAEAFFEVEGQFLGFIFPVVGSFVIEKVAISLIF